MDRNIVIRVQGKPGSGSHYAAHVIADSLAMAGAEVDPNARLPQMALADTGLRGTNVEIFLDPEGFTGGNAAAGPRLSQAVFLARFVGAALLTLMIAGAEIQLHFAPSFDVIILVVCVWWFWQSSGGRRLFGVRT